MACIESEVCMNKWEEYERRKQIIRGQARDASEYDLLIKEVIADLKL
jgi:hypothetical protein